MLSSHYTSGAAALRVAADPNKKFPRSSLLPLLTVTIPKTDSEGNNVLNSVDESSLRVVKNGDGYFVVVSMTPSCKLYKFGIEVGMELLSVDNINCTTLADEAAFFECLHNCSAVKKAAPDEKKKPLGLNTILAHPSPTSFKLYMPPPGAYVTAVIDKGVQTTSVGLMVMQLNIDGSDVTKEQGATISNGKVKKNNTATEEEMREAKTDYGKVMIKEIAPDTLSSSTSLRKGMQLISINNTFCVNKAESANLLRFCTGRVTLLAQMPTPVKAPTAYHVTATIEVPAASDTDKGTLGLTLSDTYQHLPGTGIFISKIDPDGFFADSNLRPGMQVIRINNIDCDSVGMAQALLSKAHLSNRLLTVLAKQPCQSVPPGTLLTATALKTSADAKLGVLVGMDHSAMPVIQFVREGGLMATSCNHGIPLEPGMIVHKVNNIPTKGLKTKEQVSRLLQRTTQQGTITLLVESPTTSLANGTTSVPASTVESVTTITLIQKVPRQNLGWTLGLPKQYQGRVVVTEVEEGGLAMSAGVRKGMCLFKIDNTTIDCCHEFVADAEEAVSKMIHSRPVGAPVTLMVQAESPSLLVPPIMTGSIIKETQASKVGIKLRQHKGHVAIINIAEGSASSATDLMGGMLIQSINNVDCCGKKPEEVAQLLADGEGIITMLAKTPDCPLLDATLASFVTTTVSKATREKDTAIERCFTHEEGKVWVSQDGVKGVFNGTALRVGMEVSSLNNIPCEILTPAGISRVMEESDTDYVTILAKNPKLPLGLILTDVLRKKDPEDKFGLDCTASKGWRSKVVICKIKDGSLASTSRLLSGMEVLMVNNADCSRIDAQGAATILAREAGTGDVTYVVGVSTKNVPLNNRKFATANLDMEKAGSQAVGVNVGRNHYGKVVITHIEDGSLASGTKLSEGMEILSINNQNCLYKKAQDVQALLSSTSSSLMTILAEEPKIPQGKIVIGSMVKTDPDMKVGVTMREVDDRVIVKLVVPDSLTATTDLAVGMWIKAINNKDCTKASSKEVADMLKAEVSVITILAETTSVTFDEPVAAEPDTTEPAAAEEKGGEANTPAASDSGEDTSKEEANPGAESGEETTSDADEKSAEPDNARADDDTKAEGDDYDAKADGDTKADF